MNVLICAASAIEARACRNGVRSSPEHETFEILQCGIGMERAEHSLRKRLRSGPRPDAIVSSGFAGSLQPDLTVGTWVWSTNVRSAHGTPLFTSQPPAPILETPLAWAASTYTTVSQIATASGASPHSGTSMQSESSSGAVDMESYAWATVAKDHAIPFFIIRLISDSPTHPIPTGIQAWTAAVTASRRTERLREAFNGSIRSMVSPLELARFARRSHRLLKELSAGWSSMARHWPHLGAL